MATLARPNSRNRPARRVRRKRGGTPDVRLSRTRKPDNLSIETWQTQLRRQFGAEQDFTLKNVGDQPVFSEFQVANPQSKSAVSRGHPRHAAGR